MKPGMKRRARQKNAQPGDRDERTAEKKADDPTRMIIDPIHHAAPEARRLRLICGSLLTLKPTRLGPARVERPDRLGM